MKRRDRYHHFVRAARVALSVAMVTSAFAHSKREATVPSDGEVLAAPPEVISMTFAKPMRITAVRPTGETGETFDLESSDKLRPVTEFRATPPRLPYGRYTVEWRGLSWDGHPNAKWSRPKGRMLCSALFA